MNLNPRIKIRHIQAFLSVAQHHSFAKAADELAITQPAVSKAIKELEEIVGNRLFDRTTNQVALSTAGLALLRYVGPSMRSLSEGFEVATRKEQDQPALRVGALATVTTWLVPTAIQYWYEHQGYSRIHLVNGPSAYLLSALRQGELDIVVGRMSDAKEIQHLNYVHIYQEPIVLAVRFGHPLLGNHTIRPDELIEYPWIVPQPKSTLRPIVDRFFVENGMHSPKIHLETSSLSTSRNYTLRTDTIWVAPEESVLPDVELLRLVILDVQLEAHGGSMGYCINKTIPASPELMAFCTALEKVGSKH